MITAVPEITALRAVICRVIPAGQVTVPGEAAGDGGPGRPGLDHRLVPGFGDGLANSPVP